MENQFKCPRTWEPIGFCQCETCAKRKENKGQCPVFGCTIPRGIPHEHPAGVSAVMRNPGAPLTNIERAELQYHRQQAASRNDMAFQSMIDAPSVPQDIEWDQEALDKYLEPMIPGRKLRDSLLIAGNKMADEQPPYFLVKAEQPRESLLSLACSIAWRLILMVAVVGIIGSVTLIHLGAQQ